LDASRIFSAFASSGVKAPLGHAHRQTFLKFTQRHCFSIRQRGSAEAGAASRAALQTPPIRAKAKKARMTWLQGKTKLRTEEISAARAKPEPVAAQFFENLFPRRDHRVAE